MQFAIAADGQRVEATRSAKGICGICGGELVPHCGDILTWHWSHKSLDECDVWQEGESSWHRRWKSYVVPECREVIIERDGRRHRADIHTRSGVTIELQHSSIGVAEMREREAFYGRMAWIFDVRDQVSNIDFRKRDGYYSFRWKWPRKHLAYVTKPTVLDIGNGTLFELRKMSKDVPCGGWGKVLSQDEVCVRLFGVESLDPSYWMRG